MSIIRIEKSCNFFVTKGHNFFSYLFRNRFFFFFFPLKNCCRYMKVKLNTLATVFEVWVPTVTVRAVATVPRPVDGIMTCAIPSTSVS